MNKGLVSIVVPVYNTEEYLEACIQSVLDQTYPAWELILVNDGSTDGSQAICHTYAQTDERIRLVSQDNGGVSAARNNGIAHATGQYITFLDSDDQLEAEALAVLVSDIVQYDADISSASKCVVLPDGTIRHMHNDGQTAVYEGDEMLRRSLAYDPQTRSANAKLYSTDFLKGITFAQGHHVNEDGYFLFECFVKKPRVVQHNVSLYRYCFRESSATNGSFSDKYFDMLYFCDLKAAYIRDNMPHLADDAKSMEVRTHLLFLQVLCRTKDKQYRQAHKASVKTIRRLYRYHRPISTHHKVLAWLVVLGLYPLYKAAVRRKYYR